MAHRLHFASIIFALAIIMTACGNGNKTMKQLAAVDSLLSADHPDSALIDLHSIDENSMESANFAYYGLLLTEARYRLYLPIKSDSTIRESLSYYKKNGKDTEKLSRAYYYSAMVDYDLKKEKAAMADLIQAERLTRTSRNADLRHKIYESLAYFYGNAHEIDSAMRYSKISLDYAKATGHHDWEASALDYIANCFMEMGQRDSAIAYANRCMPLINTMTPEHQAFLLADIGMIMKDVNPSLSVDLLQRAVAKSLPLKHADEELLATQFKLRQEQIEHRTEVHRMYFIIIALVLFFALVLLFIYYRRHSARARHTIQQYQSMIEDYRNDIRTLEASGKDRAREVNVLKEKIGSLRNEQTDILMAGHELYESLKNGDTIVEWRKVDFNNFIEFYRLLDGPFVKHLEEDYNKLSPKYMLFIILHHNGLADEEIQRIFAVGASTIRTTKTRIRAKRLK